MLTWSRTWFVSRASATHMQGREAEQLWRVGGAGVGSGVRRLPRSVGHDQGHRTMVARRSEVALVGRKTKMASVGGNRRHFWGFSWESGRRGGVRPGTLAKDERKPSDMVARSEVAGASRMEVRKVASCDICLLQQGLFLELSSEHRLRWWWGLAWEWRVHCKLHGGILGRVGDSRRWQKKLPKNSTKSAKQETNECSSLPPADSSGVAVEDRAMVVLWRGLSDVVSRHGLGRGSLLSLSSPSLAAPPVGGSASSGYLLVPSFSGRGDGFI